MHKQKHILIFEPQIGGHHLFWLQLICESFLALNYRVSIALDDRTPEARIRIADKNNELLTKVSIISLYDNTGKILNGSKINAIAECAKQSQCDEVFCTTLDEFTSYSFRRSAIGIYPPEILKGKLSGVYHRPRPIDTSQKGLGNFIKRLGFKRLEKNGWFKHLFLLDEYLSNDDTTNYHFLPDPWDADYSLTQEAARKNLGINNDKFVLLHYGTASKRKGLHLLLDALDSGSLHNQVFLLVAGNITKSKEELQRLKILEAAGQAKVLNYYITSTEEKICFCASDFIALPYISHYGSSGILSRAAAAKRPVIASNYHILGRRIVENALGLVFENNNIDSLKTALKQALILNKYNPSCFNKNLINYAEKCSVALFKELITKTYLSSDQKCDF